MKIMLLTVVFQFIFLIIINPNAGEYKWRCTSNSKGKKRLPDTSQELMTHTEPSIKDSLYLFHLPRLNASCSGTLYAITYYYEYNSMVNEAVFNCTVFIVNKDFVIVDSIVIESYPSEQNCYTEQNSGKLYTCFDETKVYGLQFPDESFAFAVTVSSQDNSSGTNLLAIHSSLSKYRVNAILFPVDKRRSLTKGSQLNVDNLPQGPVAIRCLWFMIDSQGLGNTVPTVATTTTTTTRGPIEKENGIVITILGLGIALIATFLLVVIISIAGSWLRKRWQFNHPYVNPEDGKGT